MADLLRGDCKQSENGRSEFSNGTAGEHFTPHEVIRLMVDLLFIQDDDTLATPSIVKTMLDPACGTGGMLSVAEDRLRDLNRSVRLAVFGQELNVRRGNGTRETTDEPRSSATSRSGGGRACPDAIRGGCEGAAEAPLA